MAEAVAPGRRVSRVEGRESDLRKGLIDYSQRERRRERVRPAKFEQNCVMCAAVLGECAGIRWRALETGTVVSIKCGSVRVSSASTWSDEGEGRIDDIVCVGGCHCVYAFPVHIAKKTCLDEGAILDG